MADYAPPPGPPPPRVPEGWKAQWNDQYKEWFYVNMHTKQSQWEKPTEPAYPSSGGPPPGAPPGYDSHQSQNTGPEKGGYGSNNPYGGSSIHSAGSSHNVNDDEAFARKLQAEEEARARQSGQPTSRGASDSYYSSGAPQYQSQTPQYQSQSQPQYSNELPARDQDRGKKGGLFGKLLGKASGSSSRPTQGYGQQSYGQQGYPQQQYGGYPQQGYGGYPPQQAYAQQPQRKHGGMGGMGGMALGAGAGLLGGALLMDGVDHMEDNAYDQGYANGGGGDDYGNDDYGGGGGDDFGGGDF
ncbi:hypothetical protein KCU93_g5297, partial [Aureobasidium melanogenum]